MFVYSLKASTLKFFAVVCVALTALVMMITFIPSYDGGEIKYITTGNESKINYSKIKTKASHRCFFTDTGKRSRQAVNGLACYGIGTEHNTVGARYIGGACGIKLGEVGRTGSNQLKHTLVEHTTLDQNHAAVLAIHSTYKGIVSFLKGSQPLIKHIADGQLHTAVQI